MNRMQIVVRCLLLLFLMMPGRIATTQSVPEQTAAMQWLKASLDRYFAGQLSMQQVTTARYARFKTDAINLEFDGGMSPDAFEKKWDTVYDTRQRYLHDAFLVPLQDWNTIKVLCRPISADSGNIWIAVDFTEEPSGEHYQRHIKVVNENDGYRIDDVLEMPVQQEAYYITGDFNGDKRQDTVSVSFTSLIDHQPIVIDTALDYDTLINTTVRRKPLLRLIAPGLNPLVLNEHNDHVLGLDYLENAGNVDGRAGDEIAVVVRYADWSGMNVYSLFSYRDRGWSRIKEVEIKEEDLPDIRSGKKKMPYK